MVGCIILVGALTLCALLHSELNLKAAWVKVQLELLLYEFELGHNATKATKNICCAKDHAFVHSTETRWFKKFHSGSKNLDDPTR